MPRLFGKDYEWDMVDGRLCLRKPWSVEAPGGVPTFEDIASALAYVEEVGHELGAPALATFYEERARERAREIIEIEPTEDGWRRFERR